MAENVERAEVEREYKRLRDAEEAANRRAEARKEAAKREKLTLVADDKTILVARAFRAKKKSDKWAVVLHGYNGNMEDV